MRLKRGQRILFIPGHAGKEVCVERRTIAFSETSQGFRLPVGEMPHGSDSTLSLQGRDAADDSAAKRFVSSP
jgi:hypothetical protein